MISASVSAGLTAPQRAVLFGVAAALGGSGASGAEGLGVAAASGAARALAHLAPGLDWDALAGQAIAAGLGPLLHRGLERAGVTVPPAPRRRLLAAYALNAVRNDAVQAEVVRVSAVLEAAGIPAVPLKGAALLATLYPDPALRVLSDLDLLVGGPVARDAARVLLAAGYEHVDAGLLLDRSQRFLHHVTLHRESRPFSFALELHHRLVTGFAWDLDSAALVARAAPAPYGGGTVRLLDAIDEATYLAAHAAIHLAEPHLKWLVDLAALAARPLDWDALIARARAFRARRGVYEGLRRAATLTGAAVPPRVLAALAPPAPVRLAFARLCPLEVAFGAALPGKWVRHLVMLLLQEGPVDRVVHAWRSTGYKVWLERARRGGGA
jgi:hypothetical protein